MSIKQVVSNGLASKNFNYKTKGIMGAVVFTTALRAASRPVVIYKDKKADEETKKYTAGKEFLYQMLSLVLTFAMVNPAKKLGFSFAKKFLKDGKVAAEELKGIKKFDDFEKVNLDLDELTSDAKKILGKGEKEVLSPDSISKLKLVKGSVELFSFVSSIVGLTIIAPALGNVVLHPIMKAVGLTKNEPTQQKVDTKA